MDRVNYRQVYQMKRVFSRAGFARLHQIVLLSLEHLPEIRIHPVVGGNGDVFRAHIEFDQVHPMRLHVAQTIGVGVSMLVIRSDVGSGIAVVIVYLEPITRQVGRHHLQPTLCSACRETAELDEGDSNLLVHPPPASNEPYPLSNLPRHRAAPS